MTQLIKFIHSNKKMKIDTERKRRQSRIQMKVGGWLL